MKIYFAGSIRGGRADQALYYEIIELLKGYGTVLTEHLGSANLSAEGEEHLNDHVIYARDRSWVEESDVIVAEVTNTSLGVGYELGLANALGKKVICLFRPGNGKLLSAMLTGNPDFRIVEYGTIDQLPPVFDAELKPVN